MVRVEGLKNIDGIYFLKKYEYDNGEKPYYEITFKKAQLMELNYLKIVKI